MSENEKEINLEDRFPLWGEKMEEIFSSWHINSNVW